MIAGTRCLFAALIIAAVPLAAAAQVIPPSEQPGRERERFIQPPTPLSQPGGEAIALPSTTAPEGADRIGVFISDIQIVGSTVYTPDQLAVLYAGMIGHEWTLKSIYDLAQRITSKYGNDGYVLSRAIVPPQQLNPQGAVVRIQVIEGYVEKVEWPPQLSRYRDFFSVYAARITAQRPVNIRTIERNMLLAGDLPGLKFATTLRPSNDALGAAVLVVEVVQKPVDANAHIDNRGTPARGPFEYYGSATLNNMLGWHEALTLTYAGVVPLRELNYAAASYKQVLLPDGLAIFGDFSYAWGTPGTVPLESLDYRTIGPYADLGLSMPVIRSREDNLKLSGLFFGSNSEAWTHDLVASDDRLRGFRFRADGDFADPTGGINQYYAVVSHGIDGLGALANDPRNPPGMGMVAPVDFTKLEGFFSHIQPLPLNVSLYGAAYGQYAFTPLLAPEQCGFGGRFFGRAFDPSELLSDSCIETTGELRYDIRGLPPQLTQTQLYGFIDWGDLYTLNQPVGSGSKVNAASTGGGVRFSFFDHVDADLSVAKAIEGPRDDWRFFFIVAARY
jgi:hemolysin activation/secretion protein